MSSGLSFLRKSVVVALLTATLLAVLAAEPEFVNPVRPKDAPPLNMLFFGNSFTLGGAGFFAYRVGGVPRLVRELAQAHGYKAPNVQETCSNGVLVKFFYDRCQWAIEGNDEAAQKQGFVFFEGNRMFRMMGNEAKPTNDPFPKGFQWDLITFCQNDAGVISSGEEMNEYALKLGELIKKHSPNARFLEYEPWARHVLLEWAAPPVRFQEKVAQAGWELVDALNKKWPNSAIFSPAGETWYDLGFNGVLYAGDLFHAESPGYYLNAMVLYRSIYGGKVGFDEANAVRKKMEMADIDEAKLRYILDAANDARITPFGTVDYSAAPKTFDQAIFQANRLRQSRNYAKAQASYDKALTMAKTPAQKAEAMRGKGDCLTGLKQFDEARKLFADILKLDGVTPRDKMLAQNSIGMSYVEQKNNKDAAEAFAKILTFHNLNIFDHYDSSAIAAELYFRTGNYEQSLKMQENVMNIPGLSSYYYLVAIGKIKDCYAAMGKSYDKMKLLKRYAVMCGENNLNPGHYTGIIQQMGDLMIAQGDIDGAAKLWDHWIEANDRAKHPDNHFASMPDGGGRGKAYLQQADVFLTGMNPAYFSKAKAKLNQVLTCKTEELAKYIFPYAILGDDYEANIHKIVPRQHAQALASLSKIDFYEKNGKADTALWLKKIDAVKGIAPDDALASKMKVLKHAALAALSCNKPTVKDTLNVSGDALFREWEAYRKQAEILGNTDAWRELHTYVEPRKDLSPDNRFKLYLTLAEKHLQAGDWLKAYGYYTKAGEQEIPEYIRRQAVSKIMALTRRNFVETSRGIMPGKKAFELQRPLLNLKWLKDKSPVISGLRSLVIAYNRKMLPGEAEPIIIAAWKAPDLSGYCIRLLAQMTQDTAAKYLQLKQPQKAKALLIRFKADKRLDAGNRKRMENTLKSIK